MSPMSRPIGGARTRRGERGRRRGSRQRWRACTARSATTSCTRTTPFRAATPCAAHSPCARRVRRCSSRCTAATFCTRPHGCAAASRPCAARPFSPARLVLANSEGIAELAREHGARETLVVHLGADVPSAARPPRRAGPQSLVTVAHLVARQRHADVLRALAVMTPRHPTLRYEIVGDGPERGALEALAERLGVRGGGGFH